MKFKVEYFGIMCNRCRIYVIFILNYKKITFPHNSNLLRCACKYRVLLDKKNNKRGSKCQFNLFKVDFSHSCTYTFKVIRLLFSLFLHVLLFVLKSQLDTQSNRHFDTVCGSSAYTGRINDSDVKQH